MIIVTCKNIKRDAGRVRTSIYKITPIVTNKPFMQVTIVKLALPPAKYQRCVDLYVHNVNLANIRNQQSRYTLTFRCIMLVTANFLLIKRVEN